MASFNNIELLGRPVQNGAECPTIPFNQLATAVFSGFGD
jgi:hypothetical protein